MRASDPNSHPSRRAGKAFGSVLYIIGVLLVLYLPMPEIVNLLAFVGLHVGLGYGLADRRAIVLPFALIILSFPEALVRNSDTPLLATAIFPLFPVGVVLVLVGTAASQLRHGRSEGTDGKNGLWFGGR